MLEVTGFDERGTILRTQRYDIPFTVGGDPNKAAETDVCLVHLNSMILLVVQEDKTNQGGRKPEAQAIAEAIATFQYNDGKRIDLNLEPLESMIIPCITMVGTRPFFYKVPVTQQLSDAVATGQYPPTAYNCTCNCIMLRSPCQASGMRTSEGMEIPDYRKIALQYYDAFRDLAKSFWSSFIRKR